jgi:hypothetical protein
MIAKGVEVAEGESEDANTKLDKNLLGPNDRRLDDPKHVVNSNFQFLERYYDQTLAEYG